MSFGMAVHGETLHHSRYRPRQTIGFMMGQRKVQRVLLVMLLTEASLIGCSESLDRIWAFFGLIDSNTLPANMQPDYEWTTPS
jgi:hypothetical protein